jgi:LuxR family maltose regulon positive regulatory protein
MATPLLTTKLYIPSPLPNLVERPRLVKRLDGGLRLGHRMTLVSAPAGFGKTTLVSDWLRKIDFPVAPGSRWRARTGWLSLDESDNDPSRFLAYFVAALQTIEANIGQGALSALQSPQPPPAEAVLTSLINEIATIPDRIVLVLDDYHLIETQPIHDALTFLLEYLPVNMHLVIATREDPHLPLARLRAKGHLTELRATDLRFTSSEAAEFLNQVMGLNLSADDIAALETRTEGWIAGLQLAAISLQEHEDASSFIKSFTGSHRFVLDYLIEEVLGQQAESIQTFLLHTSILDHLCGPLCDAVLSRGAGEQGSAGEFSPSPPSTSSGQALLPRISAPLYLDPSASGQETLEYLEHANLFIVPLDEERRWYRYHHLFADLLRQRLRQKQPDWGPTLHHRASEWYEQNGFADEAIEHALRGEDFERAAHLLEEYADALLQRRAFYPGNR